MTPLIVEVAEQESNLRVISDIHIGDENFYKIGYKKLKEDLEWCQKNKAKIFLNGDVFNVATRLSKTPPFGGTLQDEMSLALDIFRPYKDLIIGATDGNHEARSLDFMGWSPVSQLCMHLGIPYCGWSQVVVLKVGKRRDQNRFNQIYLLYFHHTTGGGRTKGANLNKIIKLKEMVEGMDVYFGSHDHNLITSPYEVWSYSHEAEQLKRREFWTVNCGSYASPTYGEQKMYPPLKIGSPVVWFNGRSHQREIKVQL